MPGALPHPIRPIRPEPRRGRSAGGPARAPAARALGPLALAGLLSTAAMPAWAQTPKTTIEPIAAAPSRGPLSPIDPAPAQGTAGPAAGARPTAGQPEFYALELNGEPIGSVRLMRLADGRLAARQVDLEAWRLRLPARVAPIRIREEDHFALELFAGVRIVVDEQAQRLVVDIPASYFETTALGGTPAPARPPVRDASGGWLNYDLYASHGTDAAMRGHGGQFEFGAFGPRGVGSASLLARGDDRQHSAVRLDTSWTMDLPASNRTLTLGDAIGSSGLWGRPVRYGGVRWGTNFALNPTYVTFPQPGLRGEAALPSVTELWVDGVRRQTGNVPPGPFQIANVPVVTGQGEVRVVARDLLGREQVLTTNYYASNQLLREGLVDESFELGWMRNDYGIASNDYGRMIAAAQHRRGVTDRLTAEGRLELLSDRQVAGLGGTTLLGTFGTLSASAAGSRGPDGAGALGALGFDRLSRTGLSVGLRGQWATPTFTQIGHRVDQSPVMRQFSGNLGIATGSSGSLNLTYVHQDFRDRPDLRIGGLAYGMNLGATAAMVLSGYTAMTGERSRGVSLTFVFSLDGRTSGAATFTGGATSSSQVQVQSPLPTGSGAAWRMLAGDSGGMRRVEGSTTLQGDVATATLEAGRVGEVSAVRGSLSGSLSLLDGRTFASRRLGDSFGVVHVPDFEGVDVYVANQRVARTDAQGYAVLPRLLPWQANAVRVEIAQLPMDTTIGAVELDAVPYGRSGTLLRFPVTRSHAALLRLVTADGTPLPVGAQVRKLDGGGDERFPVAERGETYLTGLSRVNRLEANWDGRRCRVDVRLPPPSGTPPRLGPLTCAEIAG